MGRASLANRVSPCGLRVPCRPAVQFMIRRPEHGRRPSYKVRGARELIYHPAKAFRVELTSYTSRVGPEGSGVGRLAEWPL